MSTFLDTELDPHFYIEYLYDYVSNHLNRKIYIKDYSAEELSKVSDYNFVRHISTVVGALFVSRKYKLSDFIKFTNYRDFDDSCKKAAIYIYAHIAEDINKLIVQELQTFTIPPPAKCGNCGNASHIACGETSTI